MERGGAGAAATERDRALSEPVLAVAAEAASGLVLADDRGRVVAYDEADAGPGEQLVLTEPPAPAPATGEDELDAAAPASSSGPGHGHGAQSPRATTTASAATSGGPGGEDRDEATVEASERRRLEGASAA